MIIEAILKINPNARVCVNGEEIGRASCRERV